ncbi:MAG TPA: WD40 repeat domain-containing protein, partial [Gemmataceae bacterium]|nr:WD40 repeat domain-containing protein [Gemmataceae bacterium]
MRSLWPCLVIALVPFQAGPPQPQLRLLATLEGSRPTPFASNIALSPDGKYLASNTDGMVKLWDVERRHVLTKLRGPVVQGLAFSPDSRILATASTGVQLWDVAKGTELATLKADPAKFAYVAFSPDGKTLAAAGESGKNDSKGVVTLWDVDTHKQKLDLTGYSGSIFCVAFSRDRKLVAVGGGHFASNGQAGAGEVTLWDATTGKEKATFKAGEGEGRGDDFIELVWSLAFSPDGKTLALAGIYGNVVLWDLRTGKRTATLQRFNPQGKEDDINSAYSVVFTPDGNLLIAGTLHGLKCWDVSSGKQVESLKPAAAAVWSLALSRDGKTLATAEGVFENRLRDLKEPTIKLWRFSTD